MSTSLMFLALLPGILIIIFIYRKDKVESEPKGLIIKLIIFGAISCIPAIFAEQIMSVFTEGTTGAVFAVSEAFLVAALCEELCKFLLLFLGSWKNKAFDYRFDGIVYGVSVAVGFALLENILYVAEGGLSVALMRGVLAVPLHSFCGVFMGIFYGAMKQASINRESGKVIKNMILALIVPMLIHGIYDSCAFMQNGLFTIILLIFVACMYVISVRTINVLSAEDWKNCFYKNETPEYGQPIYGQPGFGQSNFGQQAQGGAEAWHFADEVNCQPHASTVTPQPTNSTVTSGTVQLDPQLQKLVKYKALMEQGTITPEEYEKVKKKILGI